jgi:hypothetical protein
MSKRSRFLFLVAFVCAIGAGTFLSPTSVCATTGGCQIPTLAVSNFLGTIGSNIRSNLSPNLQRCHEQCDELHDGCKGVADAAYRCTLESADADLGAEKHGCGDQQSSGECKQSVRSNLSEFTSFLRSDKDNAVDTCDAAHEDCYDDCEGNED